MKNKAEQLTENFYSTVGWRTENGITEDARRWEDLRTHAHEYVSKCRKRVLKHIPSNGENILDMASGPIQYPEYLEYSSGFKKRYCADLSAVALEAAKEKIGNHGIFLQGSIFDMQLEENFFDCTISLHTIYHIDKDLQEQAVRKLIHVTKAGAPLIVVYSNPDTLLKKFRSSWLYRLFIKAEQTDIPNSESREPVMEELYFFDHHLSWWERFQDVADIEIYPWRSFDSDTQKRYFPDNALGGALFNILFKAETIFPSFFAKHFQYSMIILKKR